MLDLLKSFKNPLSKTSHAQDIFKGASHAKGLASRTMNLHDKIKEALERPEPTLVIKRL